MTVFETGMSIMREKGLMDCFRVHGCHSPGPSVLFSYSLNPLQEHFMDNPFHAYSKVV